ncbi:MAG: hypothetical protein WCI97_04310 [Bacteroidota bacterium]
MQFKNTLIALGAFVFILASCKKDPITSAKDEGAKYFPLEVGRYTIYNVDSIHFNDVTMLSDTTHFQIKEAVTSSFADSTGGTTFIITRTRRMNDTLNWIDDNIWSASVTKTRAEKTEENLRFLKMIFPITENTSWNGNQYIDTSNGLGNYFGWIYNYSDVNKTFDLGFMIMDSTVTVTEQDNENLIQKDLEREVYAKNSGMVYRIQEHVSKQNVSTPWTNPEKGTIVIMTAKEIH